MNCLFFPPGYDTSTRCKTWQHSSGVDFCVFVICKQRNSHYVKDASYTLFIVLRQRQIEVLVLRIPPFPHMETLSISRLIISTKSLYPFVLSSFYWYIFQMPLCSFSAIFTIESNQALQSPLISSSPVCPSWHLC